VYGSLLNNCKWGDCLHFYGSNLTSVHNFNSFAALKGCDLILAELACPLNDVIVLWNNAGAGAIELFTGVWFLVK